MKHFTERYSREQFQTKSDILSTYHSLDRKINYSPYLLRSLNDFQKAYFFAKFDKKELPTELCVRSAKFNFALQVWEVAQKLTQQWYPFHLNHEWVKTKDPLKKLVFTHNKRAEAENYFKEMLIALCDSPLIISSESIHFSQNNETLQLNACVNEPEINNNIINKIADQYRNNKTSYFFNQYNCRFSYDEIKDFFVYCDTELLTLLYAKETTPTLTKEENKLFNAVDNFDWKNIEKTVSEGTNINCINHLGCTPFTQLFDSATCKIAENELNSNEDEIVQQTISLADKMLSLGADINFFGYDGINALQVTSYTHNPKLMKYLLSKGANPNINYFLEDGDYSIISSALDNILSDYGIEINEDEKTNLDACKSLLIDAGAIREKN